MSSAPQTATRVNISAVRSTGGQRYDVFLDSGEILIKSGRDPEHEAARELLGKGISGCMFTFINGKPSMAMDIAKAAERSVSEGAASALRVVRWRPFDRTAVSCRNVESNAAMEEGAAV